MKKQIIQPIQTYYMGTSVHQNPAPECTKALRLQGLRTHTISEMRWNLRLDVPAVPRPTEGRLQSRLRDDPTGVNSAHFGRRPVAQVAEA